MKRKELIATIVLSVALVVSIGGNVYQFNQNKVLENALESSTTQMGTLNDSLTEKTSSLEEVTNKNSELESTVADLQSQMEELQSSLTELQNTNAELTEQLAQLQEEYDALVAKKNSSTSSSKSSSGGTSQPSNEGGNSQQSSSQSQDGNIANGVLPSRGGATVGDMQSGGTTGADCSNENWGGGY